METNPSWKIQLYLNVILHLRKKQPRKLAYKTFKLLFEVTVLCVCSPKRPLEFHRNIQHIVTLFIKPRHSYTWTIRRCGSQKGKDRGTYHINLGNKIGKISPIFCLLVYVYKSFEGKGTIFFTVMSLAFNVVPHIARMNI